MLQEVARRLRGALGTGDILARLGGDEFTVLLPGVACAAQAEGVAARLMQALCVPCRVQGFELNFGASMGIALCPQDAGDATTLLRYADMAMYHAKHRGRANFAFYAPSMGRKMAEKIQLHERLKLALAYGGLTLHYQPQVEVATNRMVGVEALLRWHDPQLGEVSPERFVPVAEATGLILELGAWVMAAACRQIAAWERQGMRLRVAVNLSAQQLRQTDLVEQVARNLRIHHVPPELLELDVTESEALADPEQACQVLNELRAGRGRGAGRLRHGPLVAGLPQAPAGVAHQGGPGIHAQRACQRSRHHAGARRGRAGAHHGAAGGRGGRGNARAAAVFARDAVRLLPGLAVCQGAGA